MLLPADPRVWTTRSPVITVLRSHTLVSTTTTTGGSDSHSPATATMLHGAGANSQGEESIAQTHTLLAVPQGIACHLIIEPNY